jgi:hypothetical protein
MYTVYSVTQQSHVNKMDSPVLQPLPDLQPKPKTLSSLWGSPPFGSIFLVIALLHTKFDVLRLATIREVTVKTRCCAKGGG